MDYTDIKSPKPIGSRKRLDAQHAVKKPEINSATQFAGFWIRVLAQIADNLILLALALIIAAIMTNIDPEILNGKDGPKIFIGGAYSALFVASRYMGTPGKIAFGLAVVREDGTRLSIGRAFGRYLAYYLSVFSFGIGFIMVAFSAKKQGLHDLVCKTIVIKRKPWPVTNRIGIILGPILIILICIASLPPDEDEIALTNADNLVTEEKYDQALPILNDLIKRRCGDDYDYLYDCAMLLEDRGYIEEMRQQPKAAYEDYSQMISLDKDGVAGYRLRGYLSFTQGDVGKALQDLDQALQVAPNDIQSLLYRANVYYGTGQYKLALTDVLSAKKQPDSEPYFASTRANTPYSVFVGNFAEPAPRDKDDVYHQILNQYGK